MLGGTVQAIPNDVNLRLRAISPFDLDQHRVEAGKNPSASGTVMTGVWIALGVGALIIVLDWHIDTKPDEKDKHKRRKPLSAVGRKHLRDIFVMTLLIAGAVWFLSGYFS